MPKEIDREEVRAFYERLPEDQFKMMRNHVAEVCRIARRRRGPGLHEFLRTLLLRC